MKSFIYHKAVYATHSNVVAISGDGETAFDLNNNPVILDQAKVDVEVERLQVEHNAQAYARNREEAYPSTGDQLDYIYHNGVAKWKTDMIDPVKDKYPKG